MELAGHVVTPSCSRPARVVARAHGVSKSWLYELMARYREQGEESLEPRSKRPVSSARRVGAEVEEEIVVLRKSLAEEGLDAGAHAIQYHLLAQRKGRAPGWGPVGVFDLAGAGPKRFYRPPAADLNQRPQLLARLLGDTP